MSLIDEIFSTLLPGRITGIQVGYSRTAVLAETANGTSCGLAATLANAEFEHRCNPSVRNAGRLLENEHRGTGASGRFRQLHRSIHRPGGY